MRRPSPVIVVGALALIAGGVAVAAPGDGPTLYACANSGRESIRFVDPGATCGVGETLITWNKQGPAGPAGTPGRDVTLQRSAAVDAAIQRADKSFAKRPKRPSKKLVARLKKEDPAPSDARAVWRDGPVQLPSALGAWLGGQTPQSPVVASLPLPAGRWLVNAKTQASLEYNPQLAVAAAGDTFDSVSCKLRAGVDSDVAGVDGFSSVLALQVVHRYAGPGLVQLECYGLLNPKLTAIKITAVRVAKLKNQPVGG